MIYVCGFLFSPDFKEVVLINKIKPVWQKNLLNGVGGKVEETDIDVHAAMEREFQEETGVHIPSSDWVQFCKIVGKEYKINFFYTSSYKFRYVKTMEEEIVELVSLSDIYHRKVIHNLRWLIPLALDPDRNYHNIIII